MQSRAARALARRALADARARNVSFALLFAFIGYANPVGYRSAYPTLHDRLSFARSFGGNASVRIFYGKPYDLLSVGGYSAWRVGGVLTIFAAVWGLLAAVKALRAQEDAGCSELVLAGPVSRRSSFLAAVGALGAGAGALWLVLLGALVAARLAVGEAAYLALSVVVMAAVFAGVGALASQFAPSRRVALELGGATLATFLLLRVVADTSSGLDWVRWATPLGWSEELRPFTGARPWVLALPVGVVGLLLWRAEQIDGRRDVGNGLLAPRERATQRLWLLSSPTALALRGELAGLLGWLAGTGFFALIVGLVSTSVSSAGLSARLQREVRRIGGASITTPAGYIGLSFLFFILAVSLFCCAQLAAARHDESEGRLETLFALPVGRRRWLGGRLVLALCGAAGISLVAAMLAWVGAEVEGARVSLQNMLEAGANCLPVALLFGSLAALAFAVVPRATAALAYGAVAATFVWQLVGGLLSAPRWLLDLSPFRHVGLVPAAPFEVSAALIMLALAGAIAAASMWLFERRDMTGA